MLRDASNPDELLGRVSMGELVFLAKDCGGQTSLSSRMLRFGGTESTTQINPLLLGFERDMLAWGSETSG